MPLVYDMGSSKKYRPIRIFHPGQGESVRRDEADVWIYETKDLKDPDIKINECVWGMTTFKFFGFFRADFFITRVFERSEAELIVAGAKDKSEVGWVKEHPLKGTLI